MKLPKYNLAYNTRDLLRSLVITAGERKPYFPFCSTLVCPSSWLAPILDLIEVNFETSTWSTSSLFPCVWLCNHSWPSDIITASSLTFVIEYFQTCDAKWHEIRHGKQCKTDLKTFEAIQDRLKDVPRREYLKETNMCQRASKGLKEK